MNKFVWLLGCAPFLLAGCEEFEGGTGTSGASNQFIGDLPDSLRAMAAPYQNLNAVRLNPADGCYVYQYAGPVETTFLPLRSKDGRPICTKRVEVEVAAEET